MLLCAARTRSLGEYPSQSVFEEGEKANFHWVFSKRPQATAFRAIEAPSTALEEMTFAQARGLALSLPIWANKAGRNPSAVFPVARSIGTAKMP